MAPMPLSAPAPAPAPAPADDDDDLDRHGLRHVASGDLLVLGESLRAEEQDRFTATGAAARISSKAQVSQQNKTNYILLTTYYYILLLLNYILLNQLNGSILFIPSLNPSLSFSLSLCVGVYYLVCTFGGSRQKAM